MPSTLHDAEPNGAGPPTETSRSTAEDVDEVLSDPHCRHLIDYLRERGEPVALSEAAAHVVARLTGRSPDDVPDGVRKRVQTWFHHGQLPLLADLEIVEYDPDTEVVTLSRPVDVSPRR